MPDRGQPTQDDLNTLHLETTDRVRVLEALALDAADEGLKPAAIADLPPYGRWFHGEEDPTVRRYLVSPPGRRFTRVLLSATDWTHEWVPGFVARLGCRAAYLMLHDRDVFTMQLHDGAVLVVDYNSSPPYFDLPRRQAGELGIDLDAALTFCVPGTTREDLRQALSPPGAIDIDGLSALRRTSQLLGLEGGVETTYGLSIEKDGRSPKKRLAEAIHIAFQIGDGEDSDEEDECEGAGRLGVESKDSEGEEVGQVLPFRSPETKLHSAALPTSPRTARAGDGAPADSRRVRRGSHRIPS